MGPGLYSGVRAGAASAAALLLLLRLRPASAQADLCFFNAGNSTFNLRQFQANT
jgi:tRNA A37 threonylcarbamoyladenosine modification protein TsaB